MARPRKEKVNRVIKRKYFNKKLNKWIEKEYNYGYRASEAPKKEKSNSKIKARKLFKGSNLTRKTKLINQTGEVRMKQIEEVSRITGIDKLEIIQFVKSRFKEGNIQTAKSFITFHSHNQVTHFLLNLEIDEDQLLEDINKALESKGLDTIDSSWIEDTKNWTVISAYKIDGPLALPNGGFVEFEWDYELGSIYSIYVG